LLFSNFKFIFVNSSFLSFIILEVSLESVVTGIVALLVTSFLNS